MRRIWVGAALVVLVVLVVAIVALNSENQVSEFVSTSMLMDIKVLGEPRVGNVFTLDTTLYLKYEYMGLFDVANGTIIYLVVPSGIEVVSGDINWTGDVAAYSNKTLQTNLKILHEGKYTIHAYARGPVIPSFSGNTTGGGCDGFHTQIYIESHNSSYKIMPFEPVPVATGPGWKLYIDKDGIRYVKT